MWDEIMDFAVRSGQHDHALTDSFKPSSTVAAGIAVLGAIAADPVVTWGAALGAVLTVLVPRAIDWYRSLRLAKREEDARDLAAYNEILALEVSKRVELEAQARQLQEETRANRHKIRDLEHQILLTKAVAEKLDSKVAALPAPDPNADARSEATRP